MGLRDLPVKAWAVDGFSTLARWIATGGGLGYAPMGPGTVASLPVAALVWWLAPGDAALLVAAALVTLVGTWAAGLEEARLGEKDPGVIVVDEIAGMLLACTGQPRRLPWVVGAFLVFRVLDIVKPFGIRALQVAPGGFGIMVDDVVAGAYTGLGGFLLARLLS